MITAPFPVLENCPCFGFSGQQRYMKFSISYKVYA